MLDAVDAVDWGAIPGPPDWYVPARAAHGLRALADAANPIQAAEAGSMLGGGGIVHGHSAAVFPAAAVAAPLLLDIAQQGRPTVRDTALGLLDEALSCYPHAGYTRVVTPYGTAVPICCAVAHQLRARSEFLTGLGRSGKSLLTEAAGHWCFEISECVAEDGGTAAFGTLGGSIPEGVHTAELQLAGELTVLDAITLEHPPGEGSLEACLRVIGRQPGELPPGSLLFATDCCERVH
ncbi:hypothetical protein ACIO6T_23395 [Streptomyces sp. NPDC087532]|uniref:hypothetical protein n=1 Tax=unclassified Streptomyces TaxID=2593676 RepID=UPI003433EC48